MRILCRVDDAQLARVPDKGPLVVVSNHVNFLEVPLVYAHLLPRLVTGYAKIEAWDNSFIAFLFNLAGIIPLQRGEADVTALRKGVAVLKAGHIMAVAPEGTRSGHGQLQRGLAGVVFLALRSGAPMQPLVFYGGERFWYNLKRLRRTDFHIVVGDPFYLDAGGKRATQQVRQQMIDEVMYQMAALLPPEYRGIYADLTQATEQYLRFPPGAESSLARALASPEMP